MNKKTDNPAAGASSSDDLIGLQQHLAAMDQAGGEKKISYLDFQRQALARAALSRWPLLGRLKAAQDEMAASTVMQPEQGR